MNGKNDVIIKQWTVIKYTTLCKISSTEMKPKLDLFKPNSLLLNGRFLSCDDFINIVITKQSRQTKTCFVEWMNFPVKHNQLDLFV